MGLNNPEAWQVRGEDPRVARTALHRLIKVRSSFNWATCGGIPDMLSMKAVEGLWPVIGLLEKGSLTGP